MSVNTSVTCPSITGSAVSRVSHAATANPVAAAPCDVAFLRAPGEDDDGYDPYSDRPPAPEPLFARDPWA